MKRRDISITTGVAVLAFCMKEAKGEDVKLTEDRRKYLVEPIAQQIDDLMDAKRLVRDGSRYVLPPSRARRPRA
jgi:hypothetical protein